MADLQWGRPDIFLGKYPNDTTTFEQLATAQNAWTKIPTPIENTTKILNEEGEKKEAKIEGGTSEAVEVSAAKKTFVFDIRKAVGRKKPVHDVNGVIKGRYAAIIVPSSGQTIVIPNLSLSVEETYDTQDGGKLSYKGHALEPVGGGALVREATANLSAALQGISQTVGVAFTPKSAIATLLNEADLAVLK